MEDAGDLERSIRTRLRHQARIATGLSWHVRVYVLVSMLLIMINVLTTPLLLWCLFPIGGWGSAVVLHWFAARSHEQREAMLEAQVQRALAKHGAPEG